MVQRPSDKKPTSKPKPPTTVAAVDEDVEGHVMNMPPGMAWDLARARDREIRKESARHPLIAEARERSRRKR